jgi:protein-S-isoprenylcysteine O-methyltransferase Ste14
MEATTTFPRTKKSKVAAIVGLVFLILSIVAIGVLAYFMNRFPNNNPQRSLYKKGIIAASVIGAISLLAMITGLFLSKPKYIRPKSVRKQ